MFKGPYKLFQKSNMRPFLAIKPLFILFQSTLNWLRWGAKEYILYAGDNDDSGEPFIVLYIVLLYILQAPSAAVINIFSKI